MKQSITELDAGADDDEDDEDDVGDDGKLRQVFETIASQLWAVIPGICRVAQSVKRCGACTLPRGEQTPLLAKPIQ